MSLLLDCCTSGCRGEWVPCETMPQLQAHWVVELQVDSVTLRGAMGSGGPGKLWHAARGTM